MSDDPVLVEYTPLPRSSGTSPPPPLPAPAPPPPSALYRFGSAKLIMIVFGVLGATVLTSLLIVFLAPGKADAAPDPGAAYFSPPYYPARTSPTFIR